MVLLPQEEAVDAVGQWSPIVSTVLVILAAILSRFHHRLIETRNDLWGALKRKTFGNRKQHRCEGLRVERTIHTRIPSAVSEIQPLRMKRTQSWKEPLTALLLRCSAPFARACRRSRKEWREFRHWIRDPIGVSLSVEAQRTAKPLLLSGNDGPPWRSKEHLAWGTTPIESTLEHGRLRNSRGSWNQGRSHSWGENVSRSLQ